MPTDLDRAIALWEEMKAQGPPPTAQTTDPYLAAREEFDFVVAPHEGGYIESDTGKIMYPNGVIVDMVTGQLVDGSWQTNPDIEGSRAWLIAIQKDWSDDKANTWRKRLSDLGYIPEGGLAETGGMALDLVNALSLYHTTRYLNGGTAPAVSPSGGGAPGIRKTFDMEKVKDTIKSWGDLIWNEPLDDDVADWWADRQVELAIEMAKKNPELTAEQVHVGSEIRAKNEFEKSPGVKGAIREAEQLEGSTKLRDHMVSLSQVTDVGM